MKKLGFKRKNYYFEDASGSYMKAMSEYKFRKAWNRERTHRILAQKVCLYCEKEFKGDKGAVLHHRKMQELEKEAKEKVFWVKRDFEIGTLLVNEIFVSRWRIIIYLIRNILVSVSWLVSHTAIKMLYAEILIIEVISQITISLPSEKFENVSKMY